MGGYRFLAERLDLSMGVFNGRIKEIGRDDTISNFVGAIVMKPVKGARFGASYTSNLAASDSMSGVVTDFDADGLLQTPKPTEDEPPEEATES